MSSKGSESYIQKLQRTPVSSLVYLQLTGPDYCATNQFAQPQFQDYSDPRGLRSLPHMPPHPAPSSIQALT
jgi:hypothetical protein